MSKNGSLVILNDLKKERKEIEKKYNEQRNKKFTDRQTTIYALGFAGIFGVACVVCPDNMIACSSMFVGYGFGVPFTYACCLFTKEEKLRKKLEQIDKDINSLELDIAALCTNHRYNPKENCFEYEGHVILDRNNNLDMEVYTDEYTQEESGPSLRLRR